jgi:hypothetical protein
MHDSGNTERRVVVESHVVLIRLLDDRHVVSSLNFRLMLHLTGMVRGLYLGKSPARDRDRVSVGIFRVRETVSARFMCGPKIKPLHRTPFLEAFYIFDVKDKLNRYLSRLNAFSGLVHHQNRPAIRRLQFCDSIIRVHQACESKTTLIEVASSFDIPHVQHDPIELRFHIIRWLNWRLTLMKGIAVIVVEKHFFVERLLGTGSNVD